MNRVAEEKAVMTALLDLDLVARVREKGTLRLCQVLKSYRDGGFDFPVYAQGAEAGAGFKALGPLVNPAKEPSGQGSL